MVALTDWLDEVLELAPGVTTDVAKRALRLSGQEFFRDALVWAQWLGPYDAAPSTVVDLNTKVPTDTVVGYVLDAKFVGSNGKYYRIYPRNLERVPEEQPVQYPSYYITTEPHLLELKPDLRAAMPASLEVRVALVPQTEDVALPSHSYTTFHDPVLSGALYRLFSSNDKPYSSGELSKYHYRIFRSGIGRFRDEARRRFNLSDSQVKFPPGWNAPGLYTGTGW